MKPSTPQASGPDRLRQHLRRLIKSNGATLSQVSTEVLGRSPDWLGKMLRGRRPFRVEEMFQILDAFEVEPAEFFADVYDLYRGGDLGRRFARGVFERPVTRFVERVAARAAERTRRDGD